MYRLLVLMLTIVLVGCGANPGPDKSIAGSMLGAAWGAGAGAIVGNQVNNTGPGAIIGGSLGLFAGLTTGIGLDMAEGTELEEARQLASLRLQVAGSQAKLRELQQALDVGLDPGAKVFSGFQILFDRDRASLRNGAVAQLQWYAESLKTDPYIKQIEVHGHSDDMGDLARNRRLSEARARTVASFMISQGISADMIKVISHGSERPLGSNDSDTGRQLNRRVEVVPLK